MIFRILFISLLKGGAGSGLYFDQKCGNGAYFPTSQHLLTNVIETEPPPNLYEADIDTLSLGLECKKFTSVDLVKASHLGTFG